MLSITLESPPLGGARSRGGLQFTASALVENLKLAEPEIKRAILTAIQEASNESRKVAVDLFSGVVRCPQSQIEDRIKSYRVTESQPLGTIVVLNKPIDLRHFRPRQLPTGVVVKTGPGLHKFYRSAFGPDIKRLGGNVFKRKSKSRTPIAKIPGVRLVAVAKRYGIDEKVRIDFQYRARVKMKRYLLQVAIGVFRGQ